MINSSILFESCLQNRKQGNGHCILMDSYFFQFSLGIPFNGLCLQSFHSAFPIYPYCAPLYATDPEPSINWPATRVILSLYSKSLIYAILLRRLQSTRQLIFWETKRKKEFSASASICLGRTPCALNIADRKW